jgi:hypothetical protein
VFDKNGMSGAPGFRLLCRVHQHAAELAAAVFDPGRRPERSDLAFIAAQLSTVPLLVELDLRGEILLSRHADKKPLLARQVQPPKSGGECHGGEAALPESQRADNG